MHCNMKRNGFTIPWCQVLFVTLLLIVSLTGCSSKDKSDESTATTLLPASTTVPQPTTTINPLEQGIISTFFLKDGLLVKGHTATLEPGPELPKAAIKELLTGLNDEDKAEGKTTGIAKNVVFLSLKVEAGTATIDLSRPFETNDTQPQIAQVVYLLTQFPEIKRVKFLIDGDTNGATGVTPLTRADVEANVSPELKK